MLDQIRYIATLPLQHSHVLHLPKWVSKWGGGKCGGTRVKERQVATDDSVWLLDTAVGSKSDGASLGVNQLRG